MVEFFVNQQAGLKISRPAWQKWLEKIEKKVKLPKKSEVSIAVVPNSEIKKLNRIYLGRNEVTDVLSFAEIDSHEGLASGNYLGEIIICQPRAERQAKAAGHSVKKEIELLLVHGFLHLLGYDHEKPGEAKVMRELEAEIVNKK